MRDQTSDKTGTVRDGGTGSGKEPGWFGVRFGLNHANRELRVCMTRAVAGVSVAGFCGLLIGVVALSRSASNNGPQSAHASSIIEPAAEEGLPKVVPAKPAPAARPRPAQVHTNAKPVVAANVPVRSAPAQPAGKPRAMPTTSATPSTPDDMNKDSVARAPGPVVAAPKPAEGRTVGHNYLVYGSYPTMTEARRTSQRLSKDGVACTIERSLPGWTKKGWYSVVGVKGYETTKNASYQSDLKSMEHLGLEPRAYRWRNTGA